MRSKMFQKSLLGAIALCFVGCAEHSMRVSPENLSNISASTPMECQIIYEESNQEYLPTQLKNNPNSSLVANYSYTVHYVNGNTDWDGLNLFNPLMFKSEYSDSRIG